MNKIINHKLYIGGKWKKSYSSKKYFTYSPITKEKIFSYCESNKYDLELATKVSNLGFYKWSNYNTKKRYECLDRIILKLKKNQERLASLEMLETGKSFQQSLTEIKNGIKYWISARNLCKKNLNKLIENNNKNDGSLIYSPVGTVGLIVPWNFPFIVISERLPFILAAGCSVIIKPSEYASASIFELVSLIDQTALPKGVINLLSGKGSRLGKMIVGHKNISMISFTGSNTIGKLINTNCAKEFKKVSLELGGKNPFIIFNDVDLDKVTDKLIDNFTFNAGQNCVGASKVYVQKKKFSLFLKVLLKKIHKIKPQSYGPLSNKKHYLKVSKIINILKNKKINPINSIESSFSNSKSYYIYPHIYVDKKEKITLLDEELFAPIIQIISFNDENFLLDKINKSKYGLAAYIWTKNKDRILKFCRKLIIGRIWINSEMINFPSLPIGGLKNSGLGKEVGEMGIMNYSNIKTVIKIK